MNRIRKIWPLLAAVSLAVIFAGCDVKTQPAPPQPAPPQPAPQSAAKTSPAPPVALPVESQPASPTAAKGEASLTRNFYFVFDGSGSMSEKCGRDKVSKIVGAKQALTKFMSIVPTTCNLGLYVFDLHGVREVVPLGPDNRAQFLEAVADIRPAHGTPLGEAIEFAVRRLVAQREKQLGYGDFRLVVVTDGEANGQLPLSQATAFAQSNGIGLYTIGLCIGHDHELRKSSVSYRAADSIADLQKGLEETLGETDAFDATAFDANSKP